MIPRHAILLALVPAFAVAQSTCPTVNFFSARTVNLKPSATSHIDVLAQNDGSYTGYEVTDAAPFRSLGSTPNFADRFASCLPRTTTAPSHGLPPARIANPPGAGSQLQASMPLFSPLALAGNFVASVSSDNLSIYFTIYGPDAAFISQTIFTPPANPSFSTQILYSVALADLNGDGNPDLIASFENSLPTGSYVASGVWVFLGNGDGTFRSGRSQVLATGAPVQALSFAIGDLNGDGRPDIVLGASDEAPQPAFYLALGNGDGGFNPSTLPIYIPPPFFGGAESAAIADLNGDGKADLVLSSNSTLSTGANVAVTLGNGDGSFQAISLYPVLNSYAPLDISTAAVAVGDVNADGIPDIVTASGSILFGDGKGGFPSRRDYASSAVGSVMLADFDGDGITDIVIGNGNPDFLSGTEPYANYVSSGAGDPSLTVLFGAGGGAFTGAPVSDIGGGESLAAADFNGDGIPDLAVTNAASDSVRVLKGRGDGTFSPGLTQLLASGSYPVKVIAADFNHDGKPDLALLEGSATLSAVQILPGNGDGTFGAPLTLPVPAALVNFIAAPDVNGDGIPDLVVTAFGSTNSLLVWLGKGDGTFSGPVYERGGDNPAVAFGDFNGDGKLDIAVTYTNTSTVTVLLGQGDGAFPNIVTSSLFDVAAGGPNTLAAADFNGDGKLDLAAILPFFQNASDRTPQIEVLDGQGNGSFSAFQLSPANGQLSPGSGGPTIFATDVNGDKLTDLIEISPDSSGVAGEVSVLTGNGDGTFDTGVPIVSLPILISPAIADFNRDGSPDVALAATGFGIAAFLNLSHPPPPLTVVSAASFAAGPLAQDSFAAAFGEGILPLSGIRMTIQDSDGTTRPAQVYFNSDSQINFLVPAGTATGPATVAVTTTTGKQFAAQTQIAAVAPALFSVGAGIAAAYALTVSPSGAQSVQPVYPEFRS